MNVRNSQLTSSYGHMITGEKRKNSSRNGPQQILKKPSRRQKTRPKRDVSKPTTQAKRNWKLNDKHDQDPKNNHSTQNIEFDQHII